MRVTRIGGPTALIEWEGWRILTDPTFDPAGGTYTFTLGTTSRKTTGPALSLEDVGEVDVVLLSHHHHADNLDEAGRAALARATTVLTTVAGAKATSHLDVRGLAAGGRTILSGEGKPTIEVEATPCRHGAPFTRPLVGPVVGFALTLDGQPHPGLWMTGDTVLYGGLRRAADHLRPAVALVHIGAVKFPFTGPLSYTMDAADAVELIEAAEPGVAVPVHVEGWSHFSEQEEAAARVFDSAPTSVQDRIRWLPLGVPVELG
ncbi:MBL fold metallo-hydrolase [Microbacterium sp. CFBP9034]|uniref:MBL fold metallo-hydrolase n=1 Tax=Microbacterium sp. CFBP9034 TaxID=3096540 RepID=UPI002A6AD044|nr:MBL fold metallo-hydrolase [Microbacterium sp. CFBP9034]MDY0907889.1 MBL fold metallo-hydrolase [Microbacterium sp. CFBP9034]